MTTLEFFTAKLTQLLGTKYAVYANHAFQARFVNPVKTPYGTQFDVNYQSFQAYADTVVAVVETQSTESGSTPYVLENASYTVSFWVPLASSIDFYADMDALRDKLRAHELVLDGDGYEADRNIRANVSVGEPYLFSPALERTGTGARAVYRIGGNISLADKRLMTGAALEIAFVINGKEEVVNNPLDFSISSTTDANALNRSGRVQSELAVAAMAQGIAFTVDDFDDGSVVYRLLCDKAFGGIEFPSPSSFDLDKKRLLPIRIYRTASDTKKLVTEYWAILEVQYSVSSRVSYGKFTVTLNRADE